MRHLRSLLPAALLLVVLTSALSHAQLLPSAALARSEGFTALLDAGQWQQAYADMSDMLHLLTGEEAWIAEQQRSRTLLGEVLQRDLKTVKSRDHYPGLPDGTYLIVCYETETRYKRQAVEVLLLMQRNGSWDICKYSIR